MQTSITWANVTRKLCDLQPWARNPRQIRDAQARRLAESFSTFGQVEPIAIGPANEVYNGHQRLNVLMAQHGPDYVVECRQASRALSEKEREKLTVYLHRGATGEWDFDALADGFELDELLAWGFEAFELGMAYGDTSTERAGQGVSSTWGQVEKSAFVPVTIGQIETRLTVEMYDRLEQALLSAYETEGVPITDSLEAILGRGLDAFLGD